MKRQCPFQAATPFEQKILNGILYPFLVIQQKQPQSSFGHKAEMLFGQIAFLFISMLCLYFSIHSWKYIPAVWYAINNPLIVLPPSITRIGHTGDQGFILVSSIIATVVALIMLRVKNLPIEFRLGTFCIMEGLIDFLWFPLGHFEMPVLIWLGGKLFFMALMNVGPFFWLLCAIRFKKWPPEMVQSWSPPSAESGQVSKTDPQ